jgi:hypothetical protein
MSSSAAVLVIDDDAAMRLIVSLSLRLGQTERRRQAYFRSSA